MPSSNAVDWPSTLPYPLVGPTRSLEPRNEVHTMESGRVRVRKYYEDPVEVHDFEWTFTADQFETFVSFFEDSLLHGEYPFVMTLQDPDDDLSETEIEMGFHEANYQFSYSDGAYLVRAVMIVELETIEVIVEFFPLLCGVVIWPEVSDGEGGGTTFECYPLTTYNGSTMPPAGTGILVVYNGFSPFYAYGEPFESFADGDLVLGSPSADSHLSVMLYGNSPTNNPYGEDWEGFTAGAITDGTSSTDSNLGAYYSAFF